MSRNSQVNERKNYHIEGQNEGQAASTASALHIFCGDRKSKALEALERELKSKSQQYVYHEDQSELAQLVAGSSKKTVVLICNEDANNQEKGSIPESYRSGGNQNVKIYTFPNRSNTAWLPNLSSPKQVIEAISAPARTSTAKIKLSSVHSIRVSKDKSAESSKSIKMVNAGASYQKVYYLHSNHNQYGANDQSGYDRLADSLEGEANFQSFRTAKELERKEPPKGKKKYLVLLSTNEASMKIMNTLKKGKLKHFDYLLLGHLDPNQQFLDDSVVLACSDPLKHLIFLLDNGFHSYSLRNVADQYVKKVNITDNSLVQPYNQQVTNLFSAPKPDPVEVQAANDYKIDNFESPKNLSKIEDAEKKKIRKIKSPAKSRINQAEVKPESTSQIGHNVNIVISQHKDQAIIENDEFRINKQGEKIMKKPSFEESKSPSTPVFAEPRRQDSRRQDSSYQQSKFNAVSPAIESQFLGKNSNGIQAKYRKNPSVIIQEMSDQYRGSNKESIMNLQPERKTQNGFEFYQHNQPYEQTSMKKVVNKVMTAEPQAYYMNSVRSLDFKTNQSIPENNQNPNSNASISTNHANTHTDTYQNNYVPYTSYSNNSPRVYSATPISVTTANPTTWSSSNQANVRTYGYQSPPKVIRKEEVVAPEQVVETKPTQKEQVRMTFGSTSSNNSSNNALNYRNYTVNGNNYNSSSSSSNYYQPPTVNYHSSNNEPYNSKIHITSGKIEQLITPVIQKETHTEEVKTNYNNNYMSPPKLEDKTSKQYITSSLFNPDEYDQIERDGRIVYRKKVPLDARQYTPTVNYAQKAEKTQESSPAVRRYEASPIRRQASPYQYTYQDKKPQQQQNKYQYNRVVENGSPRSRYEIINVPYKAEDHNLGEMIESSHKKKTTVNQTTSNTSPYTATADNKNFVSVSYRNNNQKSNYGVANTYKEGPGVRVYGVSHPRVEVERAEKYEPKVEARVQALTPSPKANLNESNWYSRMSELHSDGSILRRNNIRFGVKLQKKQEKLQPTNSVFQNKLVSGIYKINDLNKKMALNRIIRGEEYIDQQREKYIHINNKLNRFHFIIQQEMDYLVAIFKGHIANPHDKIDRFTGVSSLFNILKAETDGQAFDGGYIFAKADQIAHINSQLLPEHYFTVTIQKDQEGLLEISEAHKKIKVDQLKHFPLVQKIMLDSKLYQYVAYRNNKPEIELLADKFMNSEFILEKIETQFSPEILDCYYYQLPRLTRLYVLCDEQQLPKMLGLIKSYAELNPNFSRETCKLVCVLSNILDNDELIMSHPNVTFISNPEEIKHYRDILKYAHHQEDPYSQFLPIDNIFYYAKHAHLDEELAKHYPGRFLAFPFSKVAELYPKIERMEKLAARYGQKPKNYLVLHENVNAEKIRVEYFAKIFMLGKAKVIQNKVVRVMNTEELLELLKK